MNKVVVALLLAFVPGRADAASCPQPAGIPCTPAAEVKKNLVDKISEVTQMKSDVDNAGREWIIAQKGENREAELVAYEKYARKAEELQSAADRLLESIGESYGAAPAHKSGVARRPRTSAKDTQWMEGLKAQWKPKISFSDFDYRSYKTKDGVHYAGVNTVSAAGHTLPDGEVVISYQLLLDAVADGNPGVIAQTLYHEGNHFSALILTGWSYREDEEASAYSSDILVQHTFELSQSWRNVQNDNLSVNQNIAANRKTTAYSSTRKEQLAIKAVVDAQQADQVNLAKYYQDLKSEVDRARREQEEGQRRAIEEMLRRVRDAQPAPLNPQRPDDPASGPARIVPERPLRGAVPIKGPEGSDQIILLQSLALNACSERSFVNEERLAAVDWARVRPLPNLERGLEPLTACEARVYTRLMDFAHGWTPGMTITAGEIIAAVPRGPVGAPQGGGGSCRRGDDPFGCQPRR